jgi:hypothetical protein
MLTCEKAAMDIANIVSRNTNERSDRPKLIAIPFILEPDTYLLLDMMCQYCTQDFYRASKSHRFADNEISVIGHL